MLPLRTGLVLRPILIVMLAVPFWLATSSASGQSFFFSTGAPDGRLGGASRQESPAGIEIEAADDFLLNSETQIQTATFRGLLPTGSTTANISDVGVEIYRVFPKDSDTACPTCQRARTRHPTSRSRRATLQPTNSP